MGAIRCGGFLAESPIRSTKVEFKVLLIEARQPPYCIALVSGCCGQIKGNDFTNRKPFW